MESPHVPQWICPVCREPSSARFILALDRKQAQLAGFPPEACFRCAAEINPQLPRYIHDSIAIEAKEKAHA